jgi:hypothetical protein
LLLRAVIINKQCVLTASGIEARRHGSGEACRFFLPDACQFWLQENLTVPNLKSVAELGIVVAYGITQREPGYAHEDVIAIDPPAGTLVVRGS